MSYPRGAEAEKEHHAQALAALKRQVVRTTQRLDASGCLSIADAIFDATGVRVRNPPYTPKKVLAELKAAGR